jgi:CRISPR-associated protein Cas2
VLVMILEKLPRSLRGALSRWLIEVRPGTFLGNPSQRVRDELWKKVTQRPPLGYVLQLWSAPTPQGFEYRQYGASQRQLVDFEGVALVTVKAHRRKGKSSEQKALGSS